MIKSVTVVNPFGESLRLVLTNPEESGLIIMNIDGLGPVKATVATTALTTMDGSVFNSARADNRNVVITLRLLPQPDVETIRQKTYKFFPLKKKVTLIVETDNRHVKTEGYVESNEPTIFAENEETQISIICPDPNFYDYKEGTFDSFTGVEAMFDLPYWLNRDKPEGEPISNLRTDSRATIDYAGDSDTGLIITCRALDDGVKNFKIYNVDTRQSMTVNTDVVEQIVGAPFSKRDEIVITTTKNKKSAYHVREGIRTNVIAAIGKDSEWFQLHQGTNTFDRSAESGEDSLRIIFSYQNAYGGI